MKLIQREGKSMMVAEERQVILGVQPFLKGREEMASTARVELMVSERLRGTLPNVTGGGEMVQMGQ